MIIETAPVEDAEEILDLQKLAYISEAKIYDDYGIPPLVQTLREMQADFAGLLFLKASDDGKIVGSVRAHMEQDTCHIGRLIVHPEFRNRGIGTRLMKEIEGCFEQARRFVLFTGHRSELNLRLYRSLGYVPFETKIVTDGLTLVFLSKEKEA